VQKATVFPIENADKSEAS